MGMGGGSPGCAADGGRRTTRRRRAAAVKAEAMKLARCLLLCLGHSEERGGGLLFLPSPKHGSVPGCPRHDAASSPPPPPEQQQKETGHDEQQGDETQLFYLSISMVSLSLTSDKVVD